MAEVLARGLDRAWRVLATGFSFAAFGLGGLIAGVTVAPLLLLAVRDPVHRRRLARRGVQHGFALQLAIMRRLGVLT
ncbi:MAG: 1-acyl-sn-glycerol-3-phosphate acyltransferase, partial [Stenotrophomonas sp.]|nr:1-acyl-sn-glycerol-3-phosphate acyltransferase [Stenotrophomonas sp.]